MPRYFPSECCVATIEGGKGGEGGEGGQKKSGASVFSWVGVKTIKLSNSCLAVNMTAKWFLTERHLGFETHLAGTGEGG